MNDSYQQSILKSARTTLMWAAAELATMVESGIDKDGIEIAVYDLERNYEALGGVITDLKTLIGRSEELKADPREM